MAKTGQVGAAVYILDNEISTLDAAFDRTAERLMLTARAHRLVVPPADAVRSIVRMARPSDPDPFHRVGSVGYKAQTPRLPWYAGWIDMLRARWQLRRLGA